MLPGPQLKTCGHVHKVIALPLHAKKIKIIRVYRNNAVGTFHIKLCKKSALTERHDRVHNVIHFHMLNHERVFSNAAIHAVTISTRKIQNQALFAWLVFFGDDSKTADVKVR